MLLSVQQCCRYSFVRHALRHQNDLGCGQGSLVRAIRRLEELMRQVAAALKAIGDVDLADKFEAGTAKIKRDVVFAASLYL